MGENLAYQSIYSFQHNFKPNGRPRKGNVDAVSILL